MIDQSRFILGNATLTKKVTWHELLFKVTHLNELNSDDTQREHLTPLEMRLQTAFSAFCRRQVPVAWTRVSHFC